MARILITSGPTRQYIDPVRYLSNASSGQMGRCLVEAALDNGHDVVVVTGPVNLSYPRAAEVIDVVSTEEMLAACTELFPNCNGLIGAAAPCDYRPVEIADHKIRKTGATLDFKLVETEDVVAAMGTSKKPDQWTVGFALETEDARFRALAKLIKKCCDLVVLNGIEAIDSGDNSIEIISDQGEIVAKATGSKQQVARIVLDSIQQRLIVPTACHDLSGS